MQLDIYNMKGKKTSEKADLPANIFEAPINVDLMHQAYVRQMANARLGTHKTKSRGEVRGGGRKPWRQKGTGRARQGSIRAAQWVGGGGVHTPRPRDYSKKMPLKMRRAALRSALSVKAAEKELIIVEAISVDEPKTKLVAEILDKLTGKNSALVLVPEKGEDNDLFTRAITNLPNAKVLHANYLNIRDLLGFDRVIIPLKALDVISGFLG